MMFFRLPENCQPLAPSPACGGGLGWGQNWRNEVIFVIDKGFTPTLILPRKQGTDKWQALKMADVIKTKYFQAA